MKRSNLAFSLIEIVVTLGVLLTLLAILLPVYSRSMRKAHHTTCISNLRQIYVAYQLYAGDNDDVWPTHQPIDDPILTYLGGRKLKCHVCETFLAPWPENIPQYLNVGAARPSRDPSLAQARKDCELLRDTQLPVLLDKNHRGMRVLANYGEEAIFVTRKDGSTTMVRPFRFNSKGIVGDVPCDRRLENLNY